MKVWDSGRLWLAGLVQLILVEAFRSLGKGIQPHACEAIRRAWSAGGGPNNVSRFEAGINAGTEPRGKDEAMEHWAQRPRDGRVLPSRSRSDGLGPGGCSDTLVLVTADHETGGLEVLRNKAGAASRPSPGPPRATPMLASPSTPGAPTPETSPACWITRTCSGSASLGNVWPLGTRG